MGLDAATLQQLGVGVAQRALLPSVDGDDPALWAEPGPDGLAAGLATLVDEFVLVERRIVDGERYVADRAAARQPVPRTWHDRLRNLAKERDTLVGLIAERVPEARTRRAALHRRLDRQWAWLWVASSDPRCEARTDVWLRWLAQYEAVCDALYALDQATMAAAEE